MTRIRVTLPPLPLAAAISASGLFLPRQAQALSFDVNDTLKIDRTPPEPLSRLT